MGEEFTTSVFEYELEEKAKKTEVKTTDSSLRYIGYAARIKMTLIRSARYLGKI